MRRSNTTTYCIARAQFIASHIPVFQPLLPPPRKIWNSEDARMSIFDAAALALTFFDAEAVSRFEAELTTNSRLRIMVPPEIDLAPFRLVIDASVASANPH
jgi:hypothetical protein